VGGAVVLILLALLTLAPLGELVGWAARHAGWRNTLSEVGDDVLRSVGCGLATAACVAVLGVAVARLSLRLQRAGSTLLLLLVLLPLAAPGVMFALGEIRFWNHPANPLAPLVYTSPILLVLAETGRFLPFGVLAARALLLRLDEGPSEAARLSGRGLLARWWHVELPRLAPAAGLAALLGYVLSLRELDVNHMLPAGNATLIRYLYGVVHTGSDDKTAFLAVLLAALVLVPLAAARLLGVPGVDCGGASRDP
jgi:iron(III) transport system permease protein